MTRCESSPKNSRYENCLQTPGASRSILLRPSGGPDSSGNSYQAGPGTSVHPWTYFLHDRQTARARQDIDVVPVRLVKYGSNQANSHTDHEQCCGERRQQKPQGHVSSCIGCGHDASQSEVTPT